eukprot:266939-Ditylum_brightwellii.AAC.1
MVLGNVMKKQQGQVDSLCKHHEEEFDKLDGVKCVRWGSNNEYDKYMDELKDLAHDTQLQGCSPSERLSSYHSQRS